MAFLSNEQLEKGVNHCLEKINSPYGRDDERYYWYDRMGMLFGMAGRFEDALTCYENAVLIGHRTHSQPRKLSLIYDKIARLSNKLGYWIFEKEARAMAIACRIMDM